MAATVAIIVSRIELPKTCVRAVSANEEEGVTTLPSQLMRLAARYRLVRHSKWLALKIYQTVWSGFEIFFVCFPKYSVKRRKLQKPIRLTFSGKVTLNNGDFLIL